MHKSIQSDFDDIIENFSFPREEILSRRVNKDSVDMRQFISKKLVRKGYSYAEVGAVMNRHRTSILYLVCKRGKSDPELSPKNVNN